MTKTKRTVHMAVLIVASAALATPILSAAQNTFPTTGNVGIGTTSPSYLLHVNGEAFASGGFRVDSWNGDDVSGAPWYGLGKSTVNLWPGYPNAVQLAGYWGLNFQTGNGQMVMRGDTGHVGIGMTSPQAKLEVNGGLRFTGDPSGTVQTTAWTGVLCGGDYAESVGVSGARKQYEPGDLIVVDPTHPGHFEKSTQPYSTLVAGIYSTKPGAIGKRSEASSTAPEIPMAMIGIVPAKVSAENGAVHPGDLLVTSSTVGYAMRGTDAARMTGAVVGKALGSVSKGRGVIEALVTLQ